MPRYTTTHTTPLSLGICLSLLALSSGCNVLLDLDAFPYQGVGADMQRMDMTPVDMPEDMMPEDMMPVDMPEDMMPEDMAPTPPPRLLITEVMVDTTVQGISTEPGEYIEIYNAGEGPALRRRIQIKLDISQNNTIRVDDLNGPSSIKPGEYLVIVRQDDPQYDVTAQLSPGEFYEWSDDNLGIALNNRERTLTLFYNNPVTQADEIHDTVAWSGGALPISTGSTPDETGRPIVENRALSLRPDAYAKDVDRTAPWRWCYDATDSFGVLALRGSPGKAPVSSRCTDMPAVDPE